jgi:hypothetical protein
MLPRLPAADAADPRSNEDQHHGEKEKEVRRETLLNSAPGWVSRIYQPGTPPEFWCSWRRSWASRRDE